MKLKTTAILFCLASAPAAAGISYNEDLPADVFLAGFESSPEGGGIASLDLGGVVATVEGVDRRADAVIVDTDGYGAVAAEGRRFWKISGGTTTLRFDQAVRGFGFSYSDLESGAVDVDLGGLTVARLEGPNPNRTDSFAFWAEPGELIEYVSFTWTQNQRDGVGLDALWAVEAVPAPASGFLALLGLTLSAGRSRRRG